MAEYIVKQQVIAAVKRWDQQKLYLPADFRDMLEEIPTADVRPVVLCGNCMWFDDTGYTKPDSEMPELRRGFCCTLGSDIQACWFCGAGEQKGGDAE